MDNLTIHADGAISQGSTNVRVRISLDHKTGARTLVTDLDASYVGIEAPPGIRVDVTHLWHSPRLAEVVGAILSGSDLPAGFRWHGGRNGVRLLRANHPNR